MTLRWWWGLKRRKKIGTAGSAILIVGLITFGFFVWTGISAALDARQAYRDLQEELSNLTPVDLVQVNVYESLEGRFERAEHSSRQAHSRLRLLRAFSWVPVVGGRIYEINVLLEIGYHQGRAGKNLALAYGSAVSLPIEEMPSFQAADEVARILREASLQLELAQQDLSAVRDLRDKLGTSELTNRYGILVDRYLPAIQTIAYLSINSPESIGLTYALSRELTALQETASDPLDILANPDEATASLGIIETQAAILGSTLEAVRQATRAGDRDSVELQAVADVLDTLVPAITTLRHVSSGTKSLVVLADALVTKGFLTAEFGAIAGEALDSAREELALARDQMKSVESLLSVQGINADALLPSIGLGDTSSIPLSTTERMDILLEEAISATNFLYSFLGFGDPRTYLVIGQNQYEIRATGGFIGIAVELTISGGELTNLVFHDSTHVDQYPYADNPAPPDAIYWYLWMDKLLFRDSNWNPHFPASASTIAALYEISQGVRVDGVITSSKSLAFDLVGVLGDVTVPEFEGVLKPDQAADMAKEVLFYPCLDRHVSTRGQRCFDEDLFFSLKNRITSTVTSEQRRGLLELVKTHLDRKSIMAHVFPPVDDSLLWERGWNGAVPVVDHDHLLVVDSSLPGHSNDNVIRSWEYSVSLDIDKGVDAQLRIRYENTDPPKKEICRQWDWTQYTCYWNYFRIYISPLASDIAMPPVPLDKGALKQVYGYPEADSRSVITLADIGPARLTELGGYLTVEPDSIATVPVQYKLPAEVLRSTSEDTYEYRILFQKQPGMDQDIITLTVNLPQGTELLETTPAFNSKVGETVQFEFALRTDQVVVVPFRVIGID